MQSLTQQIATFSRTFYDLWIHQHQFNEEATREIALLKKEIADLRALREQDGKDIATIGLGLGDAAQQVKKMRNE